MLCQRYARATVKVVVSEDNECDCCCSSSLTNFSLLESPFDKSFKKQKTFGSNFFQTGKPLPVRGQAVDNHALSNVSSQLQ
jgi:hypothetical protein